MKKIAIACIACLCSFLPLSAAENDPIDLIVVLDTSSSMYPSYKDVSEYIVGPLLTEFLKMGDTFHLLSFSGAAKNEISRRIQGPEDIETIIARLLLMYPLDPHTDFIAALASVHQYLRELPENREKTIMIISDGEHSPAPGSPNAGLDSTETAKRIESGTAKLKGNGWNFYFVKVPFSGAVPLPKLASGATSQRGARVEKEAPRGSGGNLSAEKGQANTSTASNAGMAPHIGTTESGTAPAAGGASSGPSSSKASDSPGLVDGPVDVTDAVSDSLASPVVEWSAKNGAGEVSAAVGVVFAEFPENIGKKPRRLSIPVKVRNPSASSLYLETISVQVDGVDLMDKRSFLSLKPRSDGTIALQIVLPDTQPSGETRLEIAPVFAGKVRLAPDRASVRMTIVDSPISRFVSALMPYFLFIAGLLSAVAILIALFLFLRRSFGAPSRAASFAAAASSGPREEREGSRVRAKVDAEKRTDRGTVPDAALTGVQAQPGRADSIVASSSATAAPRTAPHHIAPSPIPALSTGPDASASYSASSGPSPHGGLPPALFLPKEPKSTKNALVPVARDYAVKKENARIMLSLWVKDQSRAIGRRNVHLMKAGSTLAMGGGRSDFLVFLVPMPHRIADIRYDGESCTIVPRRPSYFPDTGAEPIENCLGRTIRLVSDKGYELFFRIERFEDPLLKLNSFLHSIDEAGLPLL